MKTKDTCTNISTTHIFQKRNRILEERRVSNLIMEVREYVSIKKKTVMVRYDRKGSGLSDSGETEVVS